MIAAAKALPRPVRLRKGDGAKKKTNR